jgi:signal transduction histidine kinase
MDFGPVSDHDGRVIRLQAPSRATVQESYQLIELCNEAEREPGDVEIDCSRTTNFGPFGVALFAASFAARRSQGRVTRLIAPADDVARAFIEEVGLTKIAEGEKTGLNTLEVRQMMALDAVYTESITSILTRGVPGMTEENSYTIQLCLNELLQNVFEWSESKIGCTVLARWYRKTRSVRLAVVDRGIGIPAALRRKRIRELHRATDAAVIVAAVTTPRLTSRENQVGGLGLKTIRETVCSRRGRLTIVSHAAKITWSDDRLSQFRSPALRGTAIEIDFRPDVKAPDAFSYTPVF